MTHVIGIASGTASATASPDPTADSRTASRPRPATTSRWPGSAATAVAGVRDAERERGHDVEEGVDHAGAEHRDADEKWVRRHRRSESGQKQREVVGVEPRHEPARGPERATPPHRNASAAAANPGSTTGLTSASIATRWPRLPDKRRERPMRPGATARRETKRTGRNSNPLTPSEPPAPSSG